MMEVAFDAWRHRTPTMLTRSGVTEAKVELCENRRTAKQRVGDRAAEQIGAKTCDQDRVREEEEHPQHRQEERHHHWTVGAEETEGGYVVLKRWHIDCGNSLTRDGAGDKSGLLGMGSVVLQFVHHAGDRHHQICQRQNCYQYRARYGLECFHERMQKYPVDAARESQKCKSFATEITAARRIDPGSVARPSERQLYRLPGRARSLPDAPSALRPVASAAALGLGRRCCQQLPSGGNSALELNCIFNREQTRSEPALTRDCILRSNRGAVAVYHRWYNFLPAHSSSRANPTLACIVNYPNSH